MKRTRGDRFFYCPTREVYGQPEDEGVTACESVRFPAGGGRASGGHGERDHTLHGWFFPAQGRAKGTVVHCHGNGGNITGHFVYVAWMPSRGWNVLVFDYRGFGESGGRPNRESVVADTHAAIDYARSRDDVDASRVVLFGQSLGGAVAIVAAAQRDDLAGVAIEGAFSDYRREAAFVCKRSILLWPVVPFVPLLISRGFDAIDSIAGISPTPIFLITGTADGICDYRQTIDLHAAAGEPKSLWVIEDGRHTKALLDTDGEGEQRLDAFFTECISARDAAPHT